MAENPLTARDREEIRAGIERREPVDKIAAGLGRHRSTIYGELSRNGGRDNYSAVDAQARADAERKRPKTPMLVADEALAVEVKSRLEAKDSPMTISRELAAGVNGVTAQISHETIYRGIYGRGRRGLPAGIGKHLHRKRRCRKHRVPQGETPPKNKRLGDFKSIAIRPAPAAGRDDVGHLEGDLIMGSYNRSAIATVFDRASRHCWLADLPEGHGAEATLAALVETIETIPEDLRKTLTWDQGIEIARWSDLEDLVGIDVYIADPHSPWQRPTNECGNGLLRRWLPKGTNLGRYNTNDLRAIENRVNTIPRRSLNWRTAKDLYTEAVAMTG